MTSRPRSYTVGFCGIRRYLSPSRLLVIPRVTVQVSCHRRDPERGGRGAARDRGAVPRGRRRGGGDDGRHSRPSGRGAPGSGPTGPHGAVARWTAALFGAGPKRPTPARRGRGAGPQATAPQPKVVRQDQDVDRLASAVSPGQVEHGEQRVGDEHHQDGAGQPAEGGPAPSRREQEPPGDGSRTHRDGVAQRGQPLGQARRRSCSIGATNTTYERWRSRP